MNRMKKAVSGVMCIYSFLLINTALAGFIEVDITEDVTQVDMSCSLREAVNSAISNDPGENSGCEAGSLGADTIIFSENLSGPIVLTQADFLEVTDFTIIRTNAGQDKVRIVGNGTNRIFRVIDSRLDLEGIEVTGGNREGGGFGAAVFLNRSIGVFTDVSLRKNIAGVGGGIGALDSEVYIRKSSIIGNSARFTGGGIAVIGSKSLLFISDSTISGNESIIDGGGVYVDFDSDEKVLQVLNSTVVNNVAGRSGGGIWASEANFGLFNAIVSGNVANVSNEIHLSSSSVFGNFRNILGNASETLSEAFRPKALFENDILATSDRLNVPTNKIIASLELKNSDTYVHPLVAGSIAINAALGRHCNDFDQIGKARVSDLIFPILST